MTSCSSVLCGLSVLSPLALHYLMACCPRRQAPQNQGKAVKQGAGARTGDICKFFSFCGLMQHYFFSGSQFWLWQASKLCFIIPNLISCTKCPQAFLGYLQYSPRHELPDPQLNYSTGKAMGQSWVLFSEPSALTRPWQCPWHQFFPRTFTLGCWEGNRLNIISAS